jgi:hypothetical protein
VRLLRGGPDVTGGTLTRFFGVHVAILPGIVTVLLAVHVLLVQRHGMSTPPSIEEKLSVGSAREGLPFLRTTCCTTFRLDARAGAGRGPSRSSLGARHEGGRVRARAGRHSSEWYSCGCSRR